MKPKKIYVLAVFEELERRVLLSVTGPEVTNVTADNRGTVSIYFNEALNPATVTTSSVMIFTAGAGGTLNTPDDVNAPATVTWDATNQRIEISADLAANTAYWVEVLPSVTDVSGDPILGNYTGTFPTTTAGAFRFEANPSTTDMIAQFTIDGTDFDVQLYDSQTNFTVSIPNFLSYVNAGNYDGTFIQRTETIANSGFAIIQGGGWSIAGDLPDSPLITQINSKGNIAQEPIFSNIAGTLALANTGAADSTASEWYFNVSDNTAAFDPNYSVIGQIIGNTGMTVIQTADSYNTFVDMADAVNPNLAANQSPFGADADLQNGELANVPVTNSSVSDSNFLANLVPDQDFIVVNRVAILEVVSALPPAGVAPTILNASAPAVAAVNQTPAATFSNTPITPASSNSLLENNTSNGLLD